MLQCYCNASALAPASSVTAYGLSQGFSNWVLPNPGVLRDAAQGSVSSQADRMLLQPHISNKPEFPGKRKKFVKLKLQSN